MNKKKVKVVSIEDRIPKLKQRRKKKANRRLVFYLSIFFILISVIVYLQSPLSNIKSIKVTGMSYFTEEEVIQASQLTNQTNIWTIDHKKIEKMIQENPVIESVELQRKLPSTIHIKVTEHPHVGYVPKNNKVFAVFGNGTVLSETAVTLGNAPMMFDFTEDEYFDDMIGELVEVPQRMLNLISEIHWRPTDENKQRIMLYMNDGFVVDGTIRKFANKIQIYPSIAAQLEPGSKGVIHIGVGAYFEAFNSKTDDNDVEHESTE